MERGKIETQDGSKILRNNSGEFCADFDGTRHEFN